MHNHKMIYKKAGRLLRRTQRDATPNNKYFLDTLRYWVQLKSLKN